MYIYIYYIYIIYIAYMYYICIYNTYICIYSIYSYIYIIYTRTNYKTNNNNKYEKKKPKTVDEVKHRTQLRYNHLQ